MNELETKLERVQALLAEKGLQALLLEKVSSFAWLTCGARSYINTAATDGGASLLVTPDARYVMTNNIEATRLEQEERLKDQGWDLRFTAWHTARETAARLAPGMALGADGPVPGAVDLSAEVAGLRMQLLPEESARFRELGALCALGMDAAIRRVRPGMTEYQIAALLAGEVEALGVQAIVNLIAVDERIFAFRHPLPTEKVMERYAMLVLCGRRQGLVCSITRLVHFGRMPEEVRRKAEAVARVDAAMIAATRPGRTFGQVLETAIRTYEGLGFAGEWHLHHQGGPAGYEPREAVAVPDDPTPVKAGMAFAWNPSITGAKSEDTLLVEETGNSVISAIPGWPAIDVEIDGQVIERPAILEVT
jgi:Xaa-Pro aminopeptidase